MEAMDGPQVAWTATIPGTTLAQGSDSTRRDGSVTFRVAEQGADVGSQVPTVLYRKSDQAVGEDIFMCMGLGMSTLHRV